MGEGERLGEGMDIWGGDWGDWCSTGLIPLIAGGKAGEVGLCWWSEVEEGVCCCRLLEEAAVCCCWAEGFATTSCTRSSG